MFILYRMLLILHHHSHPVVRLSTLELQVMLLSSDVHSHPLFAEEITPVFSYGFHHVFEVLHNLGCEPILRHADRKTARILRQNPLKGQGFDQKL